MEKHTENRIHNQIVHRNLVNAVMDGMSKDMPTESQPRSRVSDLATSAVRRLLDTDAPTAEQLHEFEQQRPRSLRYDPPRRTSPGTESRNGSYTASQKPDSRYMARQYTSSTSSQNSNSHSMARQYTPSTSSQNRDPRSMVRQYASSTSSTPDSRSTPRQYPSSTSSRTSSRHPIRPYTSSSYRNPDSRYHASQYTSSTSSKPSSRYDVSQYASSTSSKPDFRDTRGDYNTRTESRPVSRYTEPAYRPNTASGFRNSTTPRSTSTASRPVNVGATNRAIDSSRASTEDDRVHAAVRVNNFVKRSQTALRNGKNAEAKHYATLAKMASEL
jgi:hypothetical protein